MAQTLRVHASNGGTSGRRLQHPNKVPATNTEQTNYPFKFASAAGDFFPDPYTRENGSSSTLGSQNQGILDDLEDFIQGSERQTNNNNKGNSLPNKMATSNSSGTNQPTANANGFQMSMNSTAGLSNKTGTVGLGLPSSVHLNNQLPSILDPGSVGANSAVSTRNLSQSNPNPANMKLLAANQPALSPQNQFNQYNTRQEMLLRGFRDVPIAPREPTVSEQYGSQQRFMSASSENQLRGLNPQTSSPYPHNYYPQESHTSQSGQRVANSQTDERNMITNQHFQWQNRLQTANHCSPNVPTNTSPGPSMSRTQIQQPGIPQRQSPYMMVGSPQQQQQQSQSVAQQQQQQPQQPYAAYIMQGGMKAAPLQQTQQYYGNMSMGRQVMGQASLPGQAQAMANQMQKPPQDYASFQQQQMQQRYSQQQYAQQMPYMTQQQRQPQQQQPFPQAPAGMPRMPSSHPQPILPKPASADMYAAAAGVRYASTSVVDSAPSQEFPPSRMPDQQLHQAQGHPPTSASYGNSPMARIAASPEMMARYASNPGAYQRSNAPPFPAPARHARHTASPNITVGSPLRSVADGSPSVGVPNYSTDGPTSSSNMPSLYPPSKLPPPFGMATAQIPVPGVTTSSLPPVSGGGTVLSTANSSVLGPAAAAAAAVLEAATSGSRFSGPAQSTGQVYVGSQDMMLNSKAPDSSPMASAQAPIVSASGMPSLQLGAMIGNVQTGRVPSPTLNELPTAEDVEAMIESMRAGESSLPAEDKEQPASQGSAPPSVGSLSASGTVAPSPSSNQPSQPQGPPIDAANNSTESHQLNNSALDMHAIDKNGSQLSPPASPLSTFSGLSPGVSPSGVSLTSSFGDEEVNLDEINPSLPSYPALSSYQFQSRTSQQQYEKFSRLYELSDEPERKEFLDKYQAFMSSQGAQIVQVPVFMRQPLDLFKFFTVVRERGGLQEVVRKKLWQGVLQALNLPTDLPNVVHVLRNQYARYLLSYEEKCSKTNLIGDMMKNNLLEASGIPPPNATVTCSEVIIPTSSLTQSQRPADTNSLHASYSTMTSEPPASLPSTYNLKDSFSEGSQYDASKLISNYRESSSSNFPMNPPAPSSSSFGTPQFPYSGERRSSLPNHPHGGYPPYMMAQRNLYPGATSLSQLFQQSSQQSGHPASNYQHSQHSQRSSPSMIGSLSSPHPMMPSPSSQEKMHPLWGSQYSPSTEPEHMFDYPPGAHSGRIARSSAGPQTHFPPAPPYGSYPGRQQNQYSPSTPPYRPSASPSPSSRQPVAAPHQASSQKVKYPQPQMQQHQQAHASSIKRELPFPNDCVESTRPVFTKKRKLTSRDLGPVEAWRVMMSLKSGLLSEATWALDTLNILLYDDNTVAYFMLSQLPGLLDNLIDHFRRYLIEIFGTFVENEISVGSAVFVKQSDLFVKPTDDESPLSDNEENSERIEKINRDAKNSFSAVVVGSTFSFPREGFQSGSSDWLMGGGDTTRHIQTHLGTLTDCDKTMERQCENKELEDKESVHSNAACEHCQGEQDNDKTKLSEIKPAKWGILCKDARCSSGSKCDVNWTKLNNESSCSPVSEEAETEVDAAVKKEDSKLEACEIKIKLNSTQNDVCDVKKSKEDQFTARLKQELDLDLDSDGEDSESDSYLQSEAVRKINVKPESIIEEQSCGKEDAPLCLRTECQDAVSRRCLCVSNILRGLSFVPGNDAEMSRHAGLLLIVGRLLMLHHKHAKRVPYRHSYLQDDIEVECPSNDRDDWWWHCLEGLRENAFVITANVAGQLDLSLYPEAISLPLLDGLLHWFVCQSAAAQDPMPTATPGTSLSPRQLVLEALAKMSILESNVDMILTTPPLTRVDKLYAMLVRLVGERGNPVTRELALVLLSNLAQGENSFVGLSDSKACISMLLEFIEDAATSMSAYASGSALAQAGFHSENFCGTSVDMLRRAASTLVCLARIRSNRALFLPYQGRILRVATLRVLDSMITNHLAEILFYLSR